MSDYRHNRAAQDQRRIKALALARAMYAELTPERRRELERSADIRPASPLTWSLAADQVARRLAWDDRHPDAPS